MKRISIIILLLLTALLLFQPALSAQGLAHDPKALLSEGDRLYKEGKYDEASRIYDMAYRLIEDPELLKIDPKSPEGLIKKGDFYQRKGQYKKAVGLYDRAYKAILKRAEEADQKRTAHSEKLAALKKMRRETRDQKKEAKRLKKQYVKELKERRRQDILKRKAERKAQAVKRKERAAKNWQAEEKRKKSYKIERLEKKQRRLAEKEALIVSRKRLQEERKRAELARRERKEPSVAEEVFSPVREVPGKLVVAKKSSAVREVLPGEKGSLKRGLDVEGVVELEEIEVSRKPEVTEEEKKKVETFTKDLAKEAGKIEKEEVSRRKKMEKRLKVMEASVEKVRKKRAKKAAARAKTREEKLQAKKEFMRARVGRIEEAMFKKKQAREKKKKEKLKIDATKKAARTKAELDRYAIGANADQRIVEKIRKMVARSDSYFEKEMYREAGKLYERAYLTLRGKYH